MAKAKQLSKAKAKTKEWTQRWTLVSAIDALAVVGELFIEFINPRSHFIILPKRTPFNAHHSSHHYQEKEATPLVPATDLVFHTPLE